MKNLMQPFTLILLVFFISITQNVYAGKTASIYVNDPAQLVKKIDFPVSANYKITGSKPYYTVTGLQKNSDDDIVIFVTVGKYTCQYFVGYTINSQNDITFDTKNIDLNASKSAGCSFHSTSDKFTIDAFPT